jgi:hypothetical protein
LVLKVDETVETKIQVLDSEGDPATEATVNYVVYDEADGVFNSGTMVHVANGIYTASWTPDEAGEWTFLAYCGNPKLYTTLSYFVEKGVEEAILQAVGGGQTETVSTFVLQNNTDEQTMLEVTPEELKDYPVLLFDLDATTTEIMVRIYIKVDGINYRLVNSALFPSQFEEDVRSVAVELYPLSMTWKVTLQSFDGEGETRNIPYRYVMR